TPTWTGSTAPRTGWSSSWTSTSPAAARADDALRAGAPRPPRPRRADPGRGAGGELPRRAGRHPGGDGGRTSRAGANADRADDRADLDAGPGRGRSGRPHARGDPGEAGSAAGANGGG